MTEDRRELSVAEEAQGFETGLYFKATEEEDGKAGLIAQMAVENAMSFVKTLMQMSGQPKATA